MPLIGQDIAPPDLHAKITGRARYAEDFRADGMVFAKMLLSPMPHARVRRIDASEALRMEGVLGIITADDVPSVEAPSEPVLTMEPVYEGEPVLAIAAVDETTAAAAIERVKVDFEPLPFVLDPLESLLPDGPNGRLEGNIFYTDSDVREMRTLKWTADDFASAAEGQLPMGEPAFGWDIGDIEAGMAEADVVISETLVHQSLTHHPMEPRSCMAYWQNGRAYVHASTQSAARCRASLASMLDMELEDLVVVAEYCGGGFGSKITAHPSMAMTALLAQKVGRPVMLRVTRYEENYIGRARPRLPGPRPPGFPQRRPHDRPGPVHRPGPGTLRPVRRRVHRGHRGVAHLSTAEHALPGRVPCSPTRHPARPSAPHRRSPDHRHARAPDRQGCPGAGHRPGRDSQDQRPGQRRLGRTQPGQPHQRLSPGSVGHGRRDLRLAGEAGPERPPRGRQGDGPGNRGEPVRGGIVGLRRARGRPSRRQALRASRHR